ncbi:MAG TPA: glycoside hydrolase family 38 C-terminal domain-containing protein [Acidimicrobiales bacterium]|nr:glycoside hydrolase family 38 C-terminal domain-containing protein [Acidimicrobiales bacterium]
MHDDRELAETRVRRTISDRIRPAIHGARLPLEVSAWEVPGEPVPVEAARAADLAPFEIGGRWGKPWGTTWFRMRGRVPDDWAGETVEAIIDFSTGVGAGFQSEGLLYRTAGGGPIRGIHPMHQAVPIELIADADGCVDVLVEAAANPVVATSYRPTPLGDPATAGDELLYRLNRAELAVRHDDVWHLDLDLQVLGGLMRELGLDDPRRFELLRAIDAAVDVFDPHRPAETAADARAALAPMWERHAAAHAHRVSAVGHAHIDSAWLWPLRETRRKCARTFASAVTLMDQYPEHRFACSQAVQYAWIEEDQPELFERIRARVADGRFLPVGSMWVEADANLPSGESLARQLVWGRRWFEDRFGEQPGNRIVWIPDVFGYAGNLPQLMAQAGCEFFLTQKLSWNQTNAFPHHTFWWEGIDGTRIFTHFPPADTYNGEVTPAELAYAVRNFRDKGRATRSMYLFGHGDGGGGPTREMLERARRVAAGGEGLDGLPRLAIESPAEFFEAARAELPDAPVWRGELYFEMHRGTYTSQARTKWGNRRGELALRELELWTAPGGPGGAAPLADIERLWKVLLLHQFHDIIPGSSIAWVHDDTEAAHAALLAEVDDRIAGALASGSGTRGTAPGAPPASRNEVVGANASPFARAEVVTTPAGPRWLDAPAHALGALAAELPQGVAPVTVASAGAEVVLDNGIVRAVVAADGTLASLLDHRAGRECLAGPGNVLQLFPDLPNTYDAWDVDQHTLRLAPTLLTDVDSVEVEEAGPMRAAVRVRRSFGASSIVQTYVLRAGSARLDVETEVDWQEVERLLKVAFPLDLRADEARYDVQYGHVRRPTHRNTSWDVARFEVCGHQWADVSEPDFGVAVLNDGKYGHDCLGDQRSTTMRLTLLRATRYPDPEADRGHHRFTYAVLPHGDGLGEVLPEAWALNLPVRVAPGAPTSSLARVDHPGVVITAVKAADDGSGDLVVRLHEAFGGRARTVLRTATAPSSVVACDLLERPISDPERVDGGAVALELRPFEVRTLRLR